MLTPIPPPQLPQPPQAPYGSPQDWSQFSISAVQPGHLSSPAASLTHICSTHTGSEGCNPTETSDGGSASQYWPAAVPVSQVGRPKHAPGSLSHSLPVVLRTPWLGQRRAAPFPTDGDPSCQCEGDGQSSMPTAHACGNAAVDCVLAFDSTRARH